MKLQSVKPSRAQYVTAIFSVINVVSNAILIGLLITGGIKVHSVYVQMSSSMDPVTLQNAQQMFGDVTYFVHQARLSFEASNGTLPVNLTDISLAATYALDGISMTLMAINRDAVYNATTTLGQPGTQLFIQQSIDRVLGDAQRLLYYIDTIASLLNRIQVNPLAAWASMFNATTTGANG